VIKIYWDANINGPDAADVLPTLCNDPPLCETGPQGTVNFNQFTLNGVADLGEPGCFYAINAFLSVDLLPNPSRYYLRIFEADGVTPLWTSDVKTLVSGYQEIHLLQSEWICGSGSPQCVVRDEQE
jgi:hypothetical protein